MKKFFSIVAAIAFVGALSSCKKEYECCWYHNGSKDTGYSPCVTQEMSKKDAEAAETTISVGTESYEFKCEPN